MKFTQVISVAAALFTIVGAMPTNELNKRQTCEECEATCVENYREQFADRLEYFPGVFGTCRNMSCVGGRFFTGPCIGVADTCTQCKDNFCPAFCAHNTGDEHTACVDACQLNVCVASAKVCSA